MIFLIILGGFVVVGLVAWILIATISTEVHKREGEEQAVFSWQRNTWI
jgi:hypothetical protein